MLNADKPLQAVEGVQVPGMYARGYDFPQGYPRPPRSPAKSARATGMRLRGYR